MPGKPLEKCDFNDVLQRHGVERVLDLIKQASLTTKTGIYDKILDKQVLHQVYAKFEKLQVSNSLKMRTIKASNASLNQVPKIDKDRGR